MDGFIQITVLSAPEEGSIEPTCSVTKKQNKALIFGCCGLSKLIPTGRYSLYENVGSNWIFKKVQS